MAKHRKTRQQKMVADHRHVTYHLETITAEVPKTTGKKSKDTYSLDHMPSQPQTTSYSYVSRDLRKTTLVTGAILIAQIFLFIIMNQM